MLLLSKKQANELIEHSRKKLPNEACGILAGKDRKVEKVYQMTNTDESSTTFFMEPKQQLKVMKEIRNLRLEMVGIYHSHPDTKAYPSTRDVNMAFYEDVSYVIISLQDKEDIKIKSFKIKNKKIQEEKLKIID